VIHTVYPKNVPPVITLVNPSTATSGETVTLDASGSYDPEGGQLFFLWMQVSGPVVSIEEPQIAQVSFVAPNVSEQTSLIFQVVVTDELGDQSWQEIVVDIKPACTKRNCKRTGGGGDDGTGGNGKDGKKK
jgi:hypothetical protein